MGGSDDFLGWGDAYSDDGESMLSAIPQLPQPEFNSFQSPPPAKTDQDQSKKNDTTTKTKGGNLNMNISGGSAVVKKISSDVENSVLSGISNNSSSSHRGRSRTKRNSKSSLGSKKKEYKPINTTMGSDNFLGWGDYPSSTDGDNESQLNSVLTMATIDKVQAKLIIEDNESEEDENENDDEDEDDDGNVEKKDVDDGPSSYHSLPHPEELRAISMSSPTPSSTSSIRIMMMKASPSTSAAELELELQGNGMIGVSDESLDYNDNKDDTVNNKSKTNADKSNTTEVFIGWGDCGQSTSSSSMGKEEKECLTGSTTNLLVPLNDTPKYSEKEKENNVRRLSVEFPEDRIPFVKQRRTSTDSGAPSVRSGLSRRSGASSGSNSSNNKGGGKSVTDEERSRNNSLSRRLTVSSRSNSGRSLGSKSNSLRSRRPTLSRTNSGRSIGSSRSNSIRSINSRTSTGGGGGGSATRGSLSHHSSIRSLLEDKTHRRSLETIESEDANNSELLLRTSSLRRSLSNPEGGLRASTSSRSRSRSRANSTDDIEPLRKSLTKQHDDTANALPILGWDHDETSSYTSSNTGGGSSLLSKSIGSLLSKGMGSITLQPSSSSKKKKKKSKKKKHKHKDGSSHSVTSCSYISAFYDPTNDAEGDDLCEEFVPRDKFFNRDNDVNVADNGTTTPPGTHPAVDYNKALLSADNDQDIDEEYDAKKPWRKAPPIVGAGVGTTVIVTNNNNNKNSFNSQEEHEQQQQPTSTLTSSTHHHNRRGSDGMGMGMHSSFTSDMMFVDELLDMPPPLSMTVTEFGSGGAEENKNKDNILPYYESVGKEEDENDEKEEEEGKQQSPPRPSNDNEEMALAAGTTDSDNNTYRRNSTTRSMTSGCEDATFTSALSEDDDNSELTELRQAQEALFSVPESENSQSGSDSDDDGDNCSESERSNNTTNSQISKSDRSSSSVQGKSVNELSSLDIFQKTSASDQHRVNHHHDRRQKQQYLPILNENESDGDDNDVQRMTLELDDLPTSSTAKSDPFKKSTLGKFDENDSVSYSDIDEEQPAIPTIKACMNVKNSTIEREFNTELLHDVDFGETNGTSPFDEDGEMTLQDLLEGPTKNEMDDDSYRQMNETPSSSNKRAAFFSSRKNSSQKSTSASESKRGSFSFLTRKLNSATKKRRRKNKMLYKFCVWNCKKITFCVIVGISILIGVSVLAWWGTGQANKGSSDDSDGSDNNISVKAEEESAVGNAGSSSPSPTDSGMPTQNPSPSPSLRGSITGASLQSSNLPSGYLDVGDTDTDIIMDNSTISNASDFTNNTLIEIDRLNSTNSITTDGLEAFNTSLVTENGTLTYDNVQNETIANISMINNETLPHNTINGTVLNGTMNEDASNTTSVNNTLPLPIGNITNGTTLVLAVNDTTPNITTIHNSSSDILPLANSSDGVNLTNESSTVVGPTNSPTPYFGRIRTHTPSAKLTRPIPSPSMGTDVLTFDSLSEIQDTSTVVPLPSAAPRQPTLNAIGNL